MTRHLFVVVRDDAAALVRSLLSAISGSGKTGAVRAEIQDLSSPAKVLVIRDGKGSIGCAHGFGH